MNSTIRLKSANVEGDIPPLNSTDYDMHWWGVDVYISNADLIRLTYGTTIATVVGALSPDPTISKAVALIGGLSAATFAYWQALYPDGVVVSVTWILTYSDSAQSVPGTW